MLTASHPGPVAGHRETVCPPRLWPVNEMGRFAGSAAADGGRYPSRCNAVGLGSLLVCDGCDRPLQLSWGPDGVRLYIFLCGCRRDGVDAALVERLVRDRVEAESALLVAGVAVEELPVVFRGLFAEVRIGHSAEDLQFVWRV